MRRLAKRNDATIGGRGRVCERHGAGCDGRPGIHEHRREERRLGLTDNNLDIAIKAGERR